jgi:mono/diheme cytochrome c family protein
MRRPLKVLLLACAAIAVAAVTAACGTQHIKVDHADYAGALLFAQRCAGCHTLSYAGTHGSASNIRTAQANNGPNFNVRCERPVTRVLYAIENGGFSGAIMPQNVVIGKQAVEVAEFVAKYAGHQAANPPGSGAPCKDKPIGTLPAASQALLAQGP